MTNRSTVAAGAAGAGFSVHAAAAAIDAGTAAASARRQPVRPEPRAGAGVVSGDSSVSPGWASQRSSRFRSRTVCQRSSGSLARQVSTSRSSRRGRPGRTSGSGAGSSFRIDPMTLACPSPSKGRVPVSISYSVAPKAKTSERASTGFPSSCSGDMYCSVPSRLPSAVSAARVGAPEGSSSAAPGSRSRASPKSSSFTPADESITLPGFRSRWTMPCRWAASSASATSPAIRSASSAGSAPCSRRPARVSPSRHSMTRKSTGGADSSGPAAPLAGRSRPTSCRVQMFGWLRPPTARASRSKRSRTAGSAAT